MVTTWGEEGNIFKRIGGSDEKGKVRINEVIVSKEKEGDTDDIKEALKMIDEGGIIKVLSGEYVLTSLLSIKNNTKIIGDGEAKILLKNDVTITGKEGIEIEKIFFEGEGDFKLFQVNNCTNISLTNCKIENIYLRFHEALSDKITLKNNQFEDSGVEVDLLSGGGTFFIEGNLFKGIAREDVYLSVFQCIAIVNGNTIIESNEEMEFVGISSIGAKGTITGNYIKASVGISSSGDVSNNSIVGNHLVDSDTKISGTFGYVASNYV
jgi:hypothetical protein